MPIKPEHRALYPANWRAIRTAAVERARHRCQRCGLANYAVGYRKRDGRFIRAGGNSVRDEAGLGELSYLEARKLAVYENSFDLGLGPDNERAIVIVLTVAHLNHDPRDCREENLQALCQRCHLALDLAHHQRNAAATRHAAKGTPDLFACEVK